MFGFKDYMTLVSYVPKKNKSVMLLSTYHHDDALARQNKNKPELILAYNKYKGIYLSVFIRLVNKLIRFLSFKSQEVLILWTI